MCFKQRRTQGGGVNPLPIGFRGVEPPLAANQEEAIIPYPTPLNYLNSKKS